MPTYWFKHENGMEFSEMMSIAQMEEVLKNQPELRLLPAAPMIHSGRGITGRKPDADFNSRLKQISKLPRSNVESW